MPKSKNNHVFISTFWEAPVFFVVSSVDFFCAACLHFCQHPSGMNGYTYIGIGMDIPVNSLDNFSKKQMNWKYKKRCFKINGVLKYQKPKEQMKFKKLIF